MIVGEGTEPWGLGGGDAGVRICTTEGVVVSGPMEWGGAGVLDEDEAGWMWMEYGREGLLDWRIMVYRAARECVVISGEGVGWEVGDGVVAGVGGRVVVGGVSAVR